MENYICYPIEDFKSIRISVADPCGETFLLTKNYMLKNNCSESDYVPIEDKSDPRCSRQDLNDDEYKNCNTIKRREIKEPHIHHPGGLGQGKFDCNKELTIITPEQRKICNDRATQFLLPTPTYGNNITPSNTPVDPCTLPVRDLTIEQKENCLKKNKSNLTDLDSTSVLLLLFGVFIISILFSSLLNK
jgi:hypothetical protein